MGYSTQYGTDIVRVLTLDANRGKGGAVRMVGETCSSACRFSSFNQGVLSARGQWILFADADGATKFNGFTKVEKSGQAAMRVRRREDLSNTVLSIIQDNKVVVCGSRRHLEDESVAQVNSFGLIDLK